MDIIRGGKNLRSHKNPLPAVSLDLGYLKGTNVIIIDIITRAIGMLIPPSTGVSIRRAGMNIGAPLKCLSPFGIDILIAPAIIRSADGIWAIKPSLIDRRIAGAIH